MTKIKQPIKKFWKSDKKPSYLRIAKRNMKNGFTHSVRFIKPKSKRKKK